MASGQDGDGPQETTALLGKQNDGYSWRILSAIGVTWIASFLAALGTICLT